MPELKRYRIIVNFENKDLKFGRYYGRSTASVAKKAFKYLARTFKCNDVIFDIEEMSSHTIYHYMGTKQLLKHPIAKRINNHDKFVIIRYAYTVKRIKDVK